VGELRRELIPPRLGQVGGIRDHQVEALSGDRLEAAALEKPYAIRHPEALGIRPRRLEGGE
jgi:hypothetical protein